MQTYHMKISTAWYMLFLLLIECLFLISIIANAFRISSVTTTGNNIRQLSSSSRDITASSTVTTSSSSLLLFMQSTATAVQPATDAINALQQQRQQQQTEQDESIIIVLNDWQILSDGRVEGMVWNHPNIENGSVIRTSPLIFPSTTVGTIPLSLSSVHDDEDNNGIIVETYSGSKYRLRNPSTTRTIDSDMSSSSSPSSSSSNIQQQTIDETKNNLMIQIKDAGIPGIISYALWELGFWTVSVPFCFVTYRQLTGHWPDLNNQDDIQKIGAEVFAFVNVARFAVPLRIGLALGTTPWIQTNIVDRFISTTDDNKKEEEQEQQKTDTNQQ